jgi:hypothetical protein
MAGLVSRRGCLLTSAYYAFPRWYEFWERRWNDILAGENWRTRKKTCPSATLSTTNPTWIDPGLRGERPATNDLSYGTALGGYLVIYWGHAWLSENELHGNENKDIRNSTTVYGDRMSYLEPRTEKRTKYNVSAQTQLVHQGLTTVRKFRLIRTPRL